MARLEGPISLADKLSNLCRYVTELLEPLCLIRLTSNSLWEGWGRVVVQEDTPGCLDMIQIKTCNTMGCMGVLHEIPQFYLMVIK